MAELTKRQRQQFADHFLRTMDPQKAGHVIGRDDGAALLCSREVQTELRRQRTIWAAQPKPEDVTRRMAAIAFGQANDCVRLAMEPGCDIGQLDLTLLSEIRCSEKGLVEIKLADRIAALEYLAETLDAGGNPLETFMAALDGEANTP